MSLLMLSAASTDKCEIVLKILVCTLFNFIWIFFHHISSSLPFVLVSRCCKPSFIQSVNWVVTCWLSASRCATRSVGGGRVLSGNDRWRGRGGKQRDNSRNASVRTELQNGALQERPASLLGNRCHSSLRPSASETFALWCFAKVEPPNSLPLHLSEALEDEWWDLAASQGAGPGIRCGDPR